MGGKKVVHVKKVPLRQCTGCNERREKKELIRIIRTPEEGRYHEVLRRRYILLF